MLRLPKTTYLERLVYYIIGVQLFSRVVLEFGLGMWWYKLGTINLLIFYCILAVDHALWVARAGFKKFPKDPFMLIALSVLALMVLQGAIVAVFWGQSVTKILEDSAPFVLIIISLLRLYEKPREDYETAYNRISKFALIAVYISILFGFMAVSMNLPTKIAPVPLVMVIYISTFAVNLAVNRNQKKMALQTLLMVCALMFASDDLNRSTLAFIAIALTTAAVYRLRTDRAGGTTFLGFLTVLPFLFLLVLPAGSKTDVRLRTIFDQDAASQSIALSQRKVEAAMIEEELERHGFLAKLFGLGSGASYELLFLNKFTPNQAHAHYAFAYNNLRYGFIGKIYVVALALLLGLAVLTAMVSRNKMTMFLGLLAVASIIYFFTWFNFFVYLTGLPLMCISHRISNPSKSRGKMGI